MMLLLNVVMPAMSDDTVSVSTADMVLPGVTTTPCWFQVMVM